MLMVNTYTFALSSNEQKFKEYHEEGESLSLSLNGLDYDEYVFERVHSEKIKRYVGVALVDDRVDYVKTSYLFHFKEENFIVFKSGVKYTNFILHKFRKRLNVITQPIYFDYSLFLNYLKTEDLDFEPVKISIVNYVKEKYMVGDVIASLSSKDLLSDLVKQFNKSISSMRLKLWDIGEVEISKDFVIKLSDSNIEQYDLLNLLKLMFNFGGQTK